LTTNQRKRAIPTFQSSVQPSILSNLGVPAGAAPTGAVGEATMHKPGCSHLDSRQFQDRVGAPTGPGANLTTVKVAARRCAIVVTLHQLE
jgi:hypothetical protein